MEQSSAQLKKYAGNLVLNVNNDILELQKIYARIKDGAFSQLTDSDRAKEKKIEENKILLENPVSKLDSMKEYVQEEKLEKILKMMKTTIQSTNTVFDQKANINISAVNIVKEMKDEAETFITDIEISEKKWFPTYLF